MFDDFKPRYAPESVIVVAGGGFRLCPVKRFVFHQRVKAEINRLIVAEIKRRKEQNNG